MVGDAHLNVHQLADLVLGGLDDLGVAMAGIGYTDTTGEVQQLTPTRGVDPAALAPLDDDVREASPNGGKDGLSILQLGDSIHLCGRIGLGNGRCCCN